MTARRPKALAWIFFASGFTGLVYQAVWTQYLGLFLGHSAYAQSLVLMLFMGGMALGAYTVSRYSEWLRNPLRAYAIAELLIGVFALVFDACYGQLTTHAYDTWFPAAGNLAALETIRWGLAFTLVLPQCILLGTTFPLMSAACLRMDPDAGGNVLAGLYFSNSIGAALGALATTYWLLPVLGLPGAMLAGGLLNLALAAASHALSRGNGVAAAAQPTPAGNSTPLLILVAAAVTGASSFIYEVTWVRMLSMALGSTLHAFELMLAAFIAGIAFGGLWLRGRADRLPSPLHATGWVQVAMGVAALLSMVVYANSFRWVGWMMSVLTPTDGGYTLYNVTSGVISLLVMFPTAFFAGMTLPLLTLALLRNGAGERAVGRVYAANTLGAIVGVVVCVHVLLPLVGLKYALWTAACADLVLGVVLLARFRTAVATRRMPAFVTAAAIACACAGLALAVRLDPLVLASSVYRTGVARLGDSVVPLFNADGKTATIAVLSEDVGTGKVVSISTNGKTDALIAVDTGAAPSPDEFTMSLVAAIPLSMAAAPQQIGVIGFGSGMTTHTMLGDSRVARVDTVEIEAQMVRGAKLFGRKVERAFSDPRSHVVIDDAKAYFAVSQTRYDIIVSEPSNPWVAGVASLFSREFYEFVPRHLAKDGLFVQWLQLYETDPVLLSSVLRAMLENFEDVQAFQSNTGDLILVASPRGRVPALHPAALGEPVLGADMARLGVRDVRDLADHFIMDRRGLEAVAAMHDVPANSDYFPLLQLRAPAARFKKQGVSLFDAVLEAPWPLREALGGPPPRTAGEPLSPVMRPLASDAMQRAADAFTRAMLDGVPVDSPPADPGLAAGVNSLRAMAATCSLDMAPSVHARAVLGLAGLTVPNVDRASLQRLWVEAPWLRCPPADPLLLDALALIRAQVQGDSEATIRAGVRLLDAPAAGQRLDVAEIRYVRGAMQLAAVSMRRPDVARQIIQKYDAALPAALQQDPLLQFLNVLSTRGLSTREASGQPTAAGLH